MKSKISQKRNTIGQIYYHNDETKKAKTAISRDELLDSVRGNPEE